MVERRGPDLEHDKELKGAFDEIDRHARSKDARPATRGHVNSNMDKIVLLLGASLGHQARALYDSIEELEKRIAKLQARKAPPPTARKRKTT